MAIGTTNRNVTLDFLEVASSFREILQGLSGTRRAVGLGSPADYWTSDVVVMRLND